MTWRPSFDPALPWPALALLAALAGLAWLIYLSRRARAPVLRGLAMLFLLLALARPQSVVEVRRPQTARAIILVDESESMSLAGRTEAARRVRDALLARLRALGGLDIRTIAFRETENGTETLGAIAAAERAAGADRLAALFVITDGQTADAARTLPPGGPPVHALIIGDPARGDRRITLLSAPALAIVGESMRVRARIDDPSPGAATMVSAIVDGRSVAQQTVAAGAEFELTLPAPRRGRSLIVLEASPGPSEISLANNRAAFTTSAIRDRLRVLLVTGAPYAGARAWRDLLKSDPAVDLVHFTILRSPDRFDPTPLEDMALIPFPTEELFGERLNEFDLIVFDRYQERDLLEMEDFESIARRVTSGGALLIAAGEAEAGAGGVFATPLAPILPSRPTGRILRGAFRPAPTADGARHPVLRGLSPAESWGPWTRQVDASAGAGQVLLSGAEGRPLLVLSRAGEGRIAQLWSDQAWLWRRGYHGGGPHGALLRRVMHWLMQEPELEEEALTAAPSAAGLSITRASLLAAPPAAEIIAPSGARATPPWRPLSPGQFAARFDSAEQGLFEIRSGPLRAFALRGAMNPREASRLEATSTPLQAALRARGGGVIALGENPPDTPALRWAQAGRPAHGAAWLGLRQPSAYAVVALRSEPIIPPWAFALLGFALFALTWRREAGG